MFSRAGFTTTTRTAFTDAMQEAFAKITEEEFKGITRSTNFLKTVGALIISGHPEIKSTFDIPNAKVIVSIRIETDTLEERTQRVQQRTPIQKKP